MLDRNLYSTAVVSAFFRILRRQARPSSRNRLVPLLLAAVGVVLTINQPLRAANFYWTGDNNTLWNQTSGANGTNWSSSPDFNNGTPGLPGASDAVFFGPFGQNLGTVLGQDFSINSLTFTLDATSAMSIGGGNLLTLGSGGLTDNATNASALVTIGSNVSLGAVETWTNNTTNAFTLNGILSGAASSNLSLANGPFVFTNANTYSGGTTLKNATTILTLSGANGSISGTSAITLNGGSVLNLDSTVANQNSQDRIADALGIISNGGTLRLLGSASAATTETVGTLTLGSGLTNITVTPGAGQTATLTFGSGAIASFARTTAGSAVNFSTTGTIAAPNVTLDGGGLIGGWATIGNLNSSSGTNVLNMATVSGGAVVPFTSYNVNDFSVSTNNTQLNTQQTLGNATTTINSLYLTGNAQLNFGTGATGTAQSTNKLIITSGLILSNAATKSTGFNNQVDLTTAALIGSAPITGGATGVSGGPTYQGVITSGNGRDLIIDTASNIQLDSIIADNGATSIGLTKNGSGILDLSDGNQQAQPSNGSPAVTEIANTFTGPVTINGGVVLTNDDQNLGKVPATNNTAAIVLNGGDLRTTRGYTLAANRGITVGPQGGTLSYNGGGTWTLGGNTGSTSKITGTGSVTFSAIPDGFSHNNSDTITLRYNPGNNDYQGSTTLNTQKATSGTSATITWALAEQIPDLSAVTLTGNPGTGSVNFASNAETIGSLASAAGVGVITNLGAFSTGGNNLSTSYGGTIAGTGAFTKIGSGTQTLAGNTSYTGATNIGNATNDGGTLLVNATMGSTSQVNVGFSTTHSGALGGSGTINAPVVVNSLGHIAPATSPTVTSTLTIGNNLTISGGATLDYNFGAAGNPGTSDRVNVSGTGNLNLQAGNDTLNITALPGFGIGTYYLMAVTGSGTFTDNAAFTLNGSSQFNYAIAPDAANKRLVLTVSAGNPNLFWTGAVSGAANGNWDIGTTANWTGATTTFANGSNVTFDDADLAAGGATSVTVAAGGVSPNTIVFSNALNDYTFGGDAITVTAGSGIAKSQAAAVTFNDSVTTPITTISAGSFTVGASSTYASTTKVDLNGGSLTVNGILNSPNLNVKTGTNLIVGATGSLGSSTSLSVVGTGAATFNNASQSLAAITGTGSIALNGSALTVTGTSLFDGTVGGATGSLLTSGTGTLALSQGNSYGGGTTVGSGSTLVLTNTSGSGSGSGQVTVGGTLRGTGSVGGPIVVNAGGTLSASGAGTWGSSVALNGTLSPGGTGTVATINLGGTSVNNGASLNYDLGNLGASDTANAASLATSGSVTVNVNGVAGFDEGQYTLVTSATTIASNAATYTVVPGGTAASFPAGDFTVTNDSTHLFLTFALAPVVWTGATDSAWNTTSANWTSNNGLYTDGVKVQFDDTNVSNHNTIAIDNGLVVSPRKVVFANSTEDYILTGPGTVGGAASIVKTGSGTATINITNNTNTGGTTITGGTLAIAADGSLGAAPAGVVANQLTINGGQLTILGPTTLATTRGIQVGNAAGTIGPNATTGGTIHVTGPASIIATYNGVIANVPGQAGILNKDGPGELDLGGTNTFTGGLNVNNGVVKLTAGNAGGAGTVRVNTGGTLALAVDLPASAPITLAGGAIGASAADRTINGDLTAATGTTSTVDLFDPTVPTTRTNLFHVGTLHGSGNINVQQAAAVTTPDNQGFRLRGPASTDYTGTITVGQAAKFETQTSAATGSPAGTGLIVLTGGVLNGDNTGTFSLFNARNNFSGSTTFGNNVALAGTGVAAINVIGSAPAGSTTNFGSLSIGNGQSLAAVSTATAGLTVAFSSVTLSGGNATFVPHPIGNTSYISDENIQLGPVGETTANSGITTNGAASLVLSAANTYSGPTVVKGGTLRLADGSANNIPNSPQISVAKGATLNVSGLLNGTLVLGNGAVSQTLAAPSAAALPNNGTVTGSLEVKSGSALSGGSGSTLTVSGGITLDSGSISSFTLGTPNGSNNATTSFVDIAGAAGLTVSGTHTVNLSGAAGPGTYELYAFTSGTPTADQFQIGSNTAGGFTYTFSVIPNQEVDMTVTIPNFVWTGAIDTAWNTSTPNWSSTGGSVFVNGANALFDDTNVSGHNDIVVDAGGVNAAQIVFNNSMQDYSISGGAIGGVASITKTGSGTVTINVANNTFTGATTISSGTLAIAADGSLGTAPVGAVANQLTINGGQLKVLGTTTLATTRGIQVGNAAGMIGANPTTGGTIDVDAGTTTFNGIIADVIGQSGTLNKTGPGELDLGGNNTFSGGMNINNGSVKLTADGAGGTNRITVNTGSSLALAADIPSTAATAPTAVTPITLATGTLGSSGATHNIKSDLTAATGTTSSVTLYDPLVPANRSETILLGTLHGSGNINVLSAAGATTPEAVAFRLRGPSSTDYTGTITVASGAKFEAQNSTASGSPAGTGLIVLTGGVLNGDNTGTFSLFNARNNFTASTTFGNNVALAGSGVAAINMVGTAPAGSTTSFGSLTIGDTQDLAAVSTATAGQFLAFTGVTLTGGNAAFTPHPVGNTSYVSDETIVLGPIGESVMNSGITMNGAAVLILTSPNTFSGPTTVQSGTLRLGAAGALPATTALSVNGGTVDFNNGGTSNDQTVASLAGTGGVITNTDVTARTFTVAQATSSTTYSGSINGNLSLVKSNNGALALDAANAYTGTTRVIGGVLQTTANGSLGAGDLVISAADTISSTVNLGSNQTIASLSGTTAGSGTASVNVASAVTLTDNQATNTSFAGSIGLAAGATAHAGGTLRTTGAGTLEIQGAPSLGDNSNINVTGAGTLKFNVTTGAPAVGTGVLVTVSDSATLELAGSVPALDPVVPVKGRADVLNNSTAPAGLHVTGTNQQVGGIDGSGTTQVETGSDLTANHIVQSALMIGGDSMTPSTLVTIAASDENGNPLAGSSSLALVGSLGSNAPLTTSSLLIGGASGQGEDLGGSALASVNLGGGSAAVPEPSTVVMALLGVAVFGGLARRRRRS